MSPMLVVETVSAGYETSLVLHDISLEVGKGEVVALIGANGAGKSTLMSTVMGLLKAASGRIVFRGSDISGLPTAKIVNAGMALVPERRQLFGDMSVEDNLRLGAYARRDARETRIDLALQYRRFPQLAERRAQIAQSMSGGEQQMAAIARALMTRPALLLLDEPSLGLAPKVVRRVMDLIVEFRKEGGTVLLVEQNARMALQISDRAYVIETGRIARSGPASELLEDASLAHSYLGGAESGADTMEARLRAEKLQLRRSTNTAADSSDSAA